MWDSKYRELGHLGGATINWILWSQLIYSFQLFARILHLSCFFLVKKGIRFSLMTNCTAMIVWMSWETRSLLSQFFSKHLRDTHVNLGLFLENLALIAKGLEMRTQCAVQSLAYEDEALNNLVERAMKAGQSLEDLNTKDLGPGLEKIIFRRWHDDLDERESGDGNVLTYDHIHDWDLSVDCFFLVLTCLFIWHGHAIW